MVFDFASRPPEVNSALIYSGAGAGPLMAASSAFNNLSSELSSNAASYESVISQLTGSEWTGPSSEAMAAAAQPYITWLDTTSAQLQEAATQATASAAAYETAYCCQHPAPGHRSPTGRSWRRSSRPTSWAKTPRRSRPTRPCMASFGLRMPPRCTATPAAPRQHPRR